MKNSETITLQVRKKYYKSFLQILMSYNFVNIEKPEDILKRYIKSAPARIPLSDNDIIREMMLERWAKK